MQTTCKVNQPYLVKYGTIQNLQCLRSFLRRNERKSCSNVQKFHVVLPCISWSGLVLCTWLSTAKSSKVCLLEIGFLSVHEKRTITAVSMCTGLITRRLLKQYDMLYSISVVNRDFYRGATILLARDMQTRLTVNNVRMKSSDNAVSRFTLPFPVRGE